MLLIPYMEIEMTHTVYFSSFTLQNNSLFFSLSDRFALLFRMYSSKDTSPNYIVFSKKKTKRLFLHRLSKKQQFYLGEKEEEAITAIRKTFSQDAENLELVPVLELIY